MRKKKGSRKMKFILLVWLLTLSSVASLPRTPVMIVPGDGGNQLEAKLSKSANSPHFFCRKNSDWSTLWLQVTDLLPGEIDCWSENIKVQFNRLTREFSNTPGVETRVPGFGSTETVEFLDPGLKTISSYFHEFVETLSKNHGYQRGRDVVAVPYDFRLTPVSNHGYSRRVYELIEEMYNTSGGQKVALVSHSMGSLVTLFLLNHQTEEWKKKYIHSWTSIAGVFGGTAIEFKLMASGDNVGLSFVRSQSVVKEQRSYETNVWMMPRPGFWPNTHVFLSSPFRNYTVQDIPTFFRDVDYDDGVLIHNGTVTLCEHLDAPRVPVHLVLGEGVKTPERFVYKRGSEKDWFHSDPDEIHFGDGDGTVNSYSLRSVLKWQTEQLETVSLQTFHGINHSDLVSHKSVVRDVVGRIVGNDFLDDQTFPDNNSESIRSV